MVLTRTRSTCDWQPPPIPGKRLVLEVAAPSEVGSLQCQAEPVPLKTVPDRNHHPSVRAAAREHPVRNELRGPVASARGFHAVDEVVDQLRVEQVDRRFVLGDLEELALPRFPPVAGAPP